MGPLTNIALFLLAYPEHARQLARIVFMGGSASVGNTSAVAEFNAAAPYRRLGLAGNWPLAVAAAYR